MTEHSELEAAVHRFSRAITVGRKNNGRYRIAVRYNNRQNWPNHDQLRIIMLTHLPQHFEVVEIKDKLYYLSRNWPGGMEYSIYVARKEQTE